MPQLSICIPTYNRRAALVVLLESIASQAGDRVHVAISDNASTDGTAEAVQPFIERFPHWTYDRADENVGPDRNYMRAAALAQGDYTLLCGSDDRFPPGALDRIHDRLGLGPDILLYNRNDCDGQLRNPRPQRFLRSDTPSQMFVLTDQDSVVAYLDRGTSLAAVFSYLSSVVFATPRWRGVTLDESFLGTGYPHAYVLLMAVKQGCRLFYEREPLIDSRGGDDSFGRAVRIDRLFLDLDGYAMLADVCFADWPAARRALLQLVQRYIVRWTLGRALWFGAHKATAPPERWDEMRCRLRQIAPLTTRFMILDSLPAWSWRLMRQGRSLLLRRAAA